VRRIGDRSRRLSDAVGSFCDRWQVGVKNLSHDGNQLAKNLLANASAYQAAEERCVDLLRRAVEGPAAGG
jgi:hypothetical protein